MWQTRLNWQLSSCKLAIICINISSGAACRVYKCISQLIDTVREWLKNWTTNNHCLAVLLKFKYYVTCHLYDIEM
jgi:hypothetical protein